MTAPEHSGFAVISAPGPLGDLTNNLVAALANGSGIEIQHVDRTTEIGANPSCPLIYVTQFPSESMIAAIAAGDLDAIVIISDPLVDVAHMMRHGDGLFLNAARSMSASLVAHIAIGQTARSHIVVAGLERQLGDLAQTLAAALGLANDPASVEQIVGIACPSRSAAMPLYHVVMDQLPGAAARDLLAEQKVVVTKLAQGLISLAQGRPNGPITWPREILLWGDQPNTTPPQAVPIIGPARTLIYGPYCHLPPSHYRAEFDMAFSAGISDIPFRLELQAGNCIARVRVEGQEQGLYSGSFRFHHDRAGNPIELLLRNERGAIDGQISFVEIRFFPESGTEINVSEIR